MFVVGQDATIYHFNGFIWRSLPAPSGVTANLNGVWGVSGANLFAVGDNGTIFHYGP